MHAAVLQGWNATVQYLAENGAALGRKYRDGKTPLDFAKWQLQTRVRGRLTALANDMTMSRIPTLYSLLLAAVLLTAANPTWAADLTWKDKPVSQWNVDDAKQVLTNSPWVKVVTPQNVRGLSPDERREGGNMEAGIGKGVGLAGLGILGPRRQAEAIARAHYKPTPNAVVVRWESAVPVRSAEQKAGETDVPTVDKDHYAIVVYDILTPKRWNLASELKGIAYLKRDTKKDLKPSHVEILRNDDGTATIVYLFPRSVEITKKDGRLEFVAQIGRLFVSQFFYTSEMQLRGELEL
jgi:hypothetical protein